jgi:myosin tail region-interacting protein MTI1
MPKPTSFVRKPFIPPPPSKEAYFTPHKPASNTKTVIPTPPAETREKSEIMEAHPVPEPSSGPEINKDTLKERILAIQKGLEYSAKPPVPHQRKTDKPLELKEEKTEEAMLDTESEGSEPDNELVSSSDPPHDEGKDENAEVRSPTAATAKPESVENRDFSQRGETEEATDSEVDPEVARRLAIRERMAKMSGGMGMHMGFGMAPPPFGKPKPQTKSMTPETPPTERQDPVPIIPGLPSRRPLETERDAPVIIEDSPKPAVLEQLSPSVGSEMPTESQLALYPSDNDSDVSINEDDRHSLASEDGSQGGEDVQNVMQNLLPEVSDDNKLHEPEHASFEESKYISDQDQKIKRPQRTSSNDIRTTPSVPTSRTFPVDSPRAIRPPPPPPPSIPPSQTAPPPVPAARKFEGVTERPVTSSGSTYDDSSDDSSTTLENEHNEERRASLGESTAAPSSRPPPPPPPPANPPGSPMFVAHPASPPPVPKMSRTFESPLNHSANIKPPAPPPVPPMTSFGDPSSADYSHEEPHVIHSPSSPGPSPFRRTYTERQPPDTVQGRGSLDVTRREGSYLAMKEENILEGQQWWLEPATPPSAFKNRPDMVFEVEDSTSTKRGGRTTITREVYVLYGDYSQTIITAQYDRDDPSQAAVNQRHLPPPSSPSKSDLELRHEQIGFQIIAISQAKLGICVGDGTSLALINEVYSKLDGCLPSAGVRSHGALVYSNIGNSSTTQFDEIRPGDVVAFRSAVFQVHGGLRGKTTTEVGKPDHVAVVQEWNGIKKKLKVLEQRREHKKVAHNSYKIGDLKSGEVHVFRPMPRSWVDW